MSIEQEQLDKLAQKITSLQNEVQQWEEAGFNRKTLVILLHHKTRIGMRDIELLLWGIETLDDYLADA